MNTGLRSVKLIQRTAVVIITTLSLFSEATILSAAPNLTQSALSSATSSHRILEDTAFTQVIAGTYYSVGLRADGSVWTWGRNLFGELGLPNTTAVANMNAPVRLSNLSDMIMISTSGSGYQLGVKKDGTVWEWGESFGVSRESQAPRQLPTLIDISQVSTNHTVSFALKKDGTVWVWMRNWETGEPSTAIQVNGLSNITNLNASEGILHALDSTGSVWVLTAVQKDNQLHISIPARVNGLPTLKQISAASSGQIYGIDGSETAWKWDLDLSSPVIKLSGKPSKVYPNLKVKSIQAGYDYALLLTKQGDVWTFGKKPTGKDGKVTGLNGVMSIAAGDKHSLVIDSMGQVWGFGANQWNEVGVPRNSVDGMVYTPQRIQNPIKVIINGSVLEASFPSVMNNNLISIPLKDVVKALGAELTITPSSEGRSLYTITHDQSSGSFILGQPEVEINGEKVNLSSPVSIANGATMVPASLLKQMGYNVNWNSKRSELNISSP